MNKQHIVNIKESLLFLSICRHTLHEMFDNKELKEFIKNEASNYQIINLIVNNIIPVEKYNIREEKKQWEIFQRIICENSKLFVDIGPINEAVSGDQGKYAEKLYDDMKSKMKVLKSAANKGKNAEAKTASENPNAPLDKIAVGATAGATASVIKFAAAKAYKDYIVNAVQNCNGKPDKVSCLKHYKDRALGLRIEKLRSGISTCNKAKNPEACKQSLQNQLNKLQSKSDSLRNK